MYIGSVHSCSRSFVLRDHKILGGCAAFVVQLHLYFAHAWNCSGYLFWLDFNSKGCSLETPENGAFAPDSRHNNDRNGSLDAFPLEIAVCLWKALGSKTVDSQRTVSSDNLLKKAQE